eukprot:GEZU01009404.1.p1 GENE.GEZU01009404.1~~GEZU01009404.1.p1  ORF type:complete len:360 (+),score=123.49 GEZU01009404.1:69-1148(+)
MGKTTNSAASSKTTTNDNSAEKGQTESTAPYIVANNGNDAESSFFQHMKVRQSTYLVHAQLADARGAIVDRLNSMLLSYNDSLEGALVAYKNLTFSTTTARIRYDSPYNTLDIQYDALVFTPRVGDALLEGYVTNVSSEYIALIVFGFWNVTISSPNVDSNLFKYNPETESWEHIPTKTPIGIGSRLLFKITRVNTVPILSLQGALTTDSWIDETIYLQKQQEKEAAENAERAKKEAEEQDKKRKAESEAEGDEDEVKEENKEPNKKDTNIDEEEADVEAKEEEEAEAPKKKKKTAKKAKKDKSDNDGDDNDEKAEAAVEAKEQEDEEEVEDKKNKKKTQDKKQKKEKKSSKKSTEKST